MEELKEIQKLEGHTARDWSLAWNPTTGTVRIWQQNPSLSSNPWECKAVLDETHTKSVRSCAWSPSGKLLATASFDNTTAFWDVDNDFECVATLVGHYDAVRSVAWNSSGSLLATCGRDECVWIWEVLPGNEFEYLSILPGHTEDDVKMVRWHPFMDVLFSCSYDNTIKVWGPGDDDSDEWECLQTLDESNNEHSATTKMVTCSDDLTLRIWGNDNSAKNKQTKNGDEFSPWRHLCTLSGHHDRTILSVHWSREGGIASGAADDAICLFVEHNDELVEEPSPSYKLLLKKEKAHDMDVNSVQSFKENRQASSLCK
ncbi:hypothetical protein AQUCO_06700028v1 [Aquilegia coerulea]|uniref:Uncharacterized protein n=1 Tax=Aquilegia coerulea TaxID=218851 RepID=A0A2G5CBV1_AQUCA|nr:hypothetical protein AQUCO_06700028v1 [Aquilegia coerulea]